MEGIELTKQVKIRTQRKETYKYLGILEVDAIKKVEMKEKLKMSYWREPENNSKWNCITENCYILICRIITTQ